MNFVKILKPDYLKDKIAKINGNKFKYPSQNFWVQPVILVEDNSNALIIDWEVIKNMDKNIDKEISDLLDGCWLRTWTNKKFNYHTFTENDICIEDIAHHLSLENRFCGACKFAYPVAYHSLQGCEYVSDKAKLAFLMHDSGEAYTKDIPRPLKNYLRFIGCTAIDELEEKIFKTIVKKYNIPWNDEIKQEVKLIDNRMYLNEKSQIQPQCEIVIPESEKLPFKIIEIAPIVIERFFLVEFNSLCK